MKLKSLYISSFGKLKDYSYEFSDGINTVKEENGWGKSTLATFIKCMFYGINDSKRSLPENERLKFRPWNSTEKFGGNIIFTWGDTDYKIERFFGTKQSDDTVRLFEAKTGKEFSNTENLGKRIFEIDEDGFFSTTYLSQKDFEIKSNTSLTAKFNSNSSESSDEAFDKAIEKIVKRKKTLKGRADSGLISEIKDKIYSVDNKIAAAKNAADTVFSLKKNLEDNENLQEELNKKYRELSVNLEDVGKAEAIRLKKERYNKLSIDKEKLLNEKRENDKVLNNNEISSNEINDLENSVVSLSNIYIAKKNIESEKAEKKVDKKPVIFGLISLAILILGIVSIFAINVILGAVFSVLGLVGLTICIIFFVKGRGTDKKKDYNEYDKLIVNSESAIKAVFSKFNLGEGSFDLLLERLKTAVNNGRIISDKIAEVDKELNALSIDEDIKKEVNYSGDFSLQREKLNEVKNKLNEVSSNIARIKAQINYNEENASQIFSLNEERQELFDKANEYEEEFKVLSLTEEYLNKADETLKIKYKAPLQESLDKFMRLAISEEFKANIDIDLKLSVLENGREVNTEYYSKGYNNLLDICKRFALTEVLFNKEKPFIILDDPFTNLDEEKLKLCTDLLEKLSSEYQILYLICHDSRRV